MTLIEGLSKQFFSTDCKCVEAMHAMSSVVAFRQNYPCGIWHVDDNVACEMSSTNASPDSSSVVPTRVSLYLSATNNTTTTQIRPDECQTFSMNIFPQTFPRTILPTLVTLHGLSTLATIAEFGDCRQNK